MAYIFKQSKKQLILGLLVFFMCFAVIITGCGLQESEEQLQTPTYVATNENTDITTSENAETSADILGLTEAHVVRVIDGDTFVLDTGDRVRFIGVDAPEIGEPGADEATRFVREKTEGQTVWLEADGNDRDRFDRLRRYVWLQLPTDTQDKAQIRSYQLNAMLLENGLAEVVIFGDVRNEALFRQLAAMAATAPYPQPTPSSNPGAATSDPMTASEPVSAGFIGNRNSQIFHSTTCNTLPAPQNRIYFETREAAINAGHRACRNCSP